MTLNLSHWRRGEHDLKPHVSVIGVGGGGRNAVDNMINYHIEGFEFLVADTDVQALANSKCERRIQLGINIAKGMGAASWPEIGRAAAEESIGQVVDELRGSNIVFITAGMGGGTGSGAVPVIAQAMRQCGILTVGVVTKPFHFEGAHRMRIAENGIQDLQQFVDTLIVIPNQNLFRVANERTTFADAFAMVDHVLYLGVRGVTDLMLMPGLINLDFGDIHTIMSEMGKAMVGAGEAEGENRAVAAAEAAISNPLLDDVSLKGARGVLINVTGGFDMTLFEVDEAANRIRDEVHPEANIIFGSTFDKSLDGKIRISVVATGIENEVAVGPRRPPTLAAKNGLVIPVGKELPHTPLLFRPIPDDPAHPPAPPTDLDSRRLPIRLADVGSIWLRIHEADRDPLFFGPAPGEPPGQRFDAPAGEFRTLYLGQSFEACFVEKFLRIAKGMLLPCGKLQKAAVSTGVTLRPLRLVELLDDGLFHVGATTASIDGNYALSRQWASALFHHPDKPDGLLYRSRWSNDQICVAVFDRLPDTMRFTATELLVPDDDRLATVLRRYGVGLT